MKRLSKDARSYITTAVAAIILLGGASGINLAYSNAYIPTTQAATDGTTDTQQATDATSDTQTADQAADAQQAAGDAAPAADATQQASTDNGSSAGTTNSGSSNSNSGNTGSDASASTPAQQTSPGGHWETYYTTEQQIIGYNDVYKTVYIDHITGEQFDNMNKQLQGDGWSSKQVKTGQQTPIYAPVQVPHQRWVSD